MHTRARHAHQTPCRTQSTHTDTSTPRTPRARAHKSIYTHAPAAPTSGEELMRNVERGVQEDVEEMERKANWRHATGTGKVSVRRGLGGSRSGGAPRRRRRRRRKRAAQDISLQARRGNAPTPHPRHTCGQGGRQGVGTSLSGPRADQGGKAVKGGALISEQRRDARSRSARSPPAATIGLSALRMRRAKSAARTDNSARTATCSHHLQRAQRRRF